MKINFLPIKTLDKFKYQTPPETPEILICSPEQAWLLCRELGAAATWTRRILISWLLCKGKIYCSLPKEEALQRRGTTVRVTKRQPQNTQSLWLYRCATSQKKDGRKLLESRARRGSKSQRHLSHSNLPYLCFWGPSARWKGSKEERLLALSSKHSSHTKAA